MSEFMRGEQGAMSLGLGAKVVAGLTGAGVLGTGGLMLLTNESTTTVTTPTTEAIASTTTTTSLGGELCVDGVNDVRSLTGQADADTKSFLGNLNLTRPLVEQLTDTTRDGRQTGLCGDAAATAALAASVEVIGSGGTEVRLVDGLLSGRAAEKFRKYAESKLIWQQDIANIAPYLRSYAPKSQIGRQGSMVSLFDPRRADGKVVNGFGLNPVVTGAELGKGFLSAENTEVTGDPALSGLMILENGRLIVDRTTGPEAADVKLVEQADVTVAPNTSSTTSSTAPNTSTSSSSSTTSPQSTTSSSVLRGAVAGDKGEDAKVTPTHTGRVTIPAKKTTGDQPGRKRSSGTDQSKKAGGSTGGSTVVTRGGIQGSSTSIQNTGGKDTGNGGKDCNTGCGPATPTNGGEKNTGTTPVNVDTSAPKGPEATVTTIKTPGSTIVIETTSTTRPDGTTTTIRRTTTTLPNGTTTTRVATTVPNTTVPPTTEAPTTTRPAPTTTEAPTTTRPAPTTTEAPTTTRPAPTTTEAPTTTRPAPTTTPTTVKKGEDPDCGDTCNA